MIQMMENTEDLGLSVTEGSEITVMKRSDPFELKNENSVSSVNSVAMRSVVGVCLTDFVFKL